MVLLLAMAAHAACEHTPLPGGAQEGMAREARESAGAIYGAVQTLNREVVDRLDKDSVGAFYVGDTTVFGAARIPAFDAGCDQPYARYPFDFNAVNLAMAVGNERVRFLYSTSALMYYVPANNIMRPVHVGINAIGGTYWALAAPLVGPDDDAFSGGSSDFPAGLDYDFLAGVQVDAVVVHAAAGYVGSGGVYGSVGSKPLHAFSRAVTSHDFRRLPELAAGVSRAPIGGGLLTSIYGRRLDNGPVVDDTPLLERPAINTAHFLQENIGRSVDLHVAPQFLDDGLRLYQAVVRLHTPWEDEMLDEGGTPDTLPGVFFGTVRVQEQPMFGIEGGPRLHAGASLGFAAEGLHAKLALSVNDDEVLAAFPFAQDSLYMKLQVGGVF